MHAGDFFNFYTLVQYQSEYKLSVSALVSGWSCIPPFSASNPSVSVMCLDACHCELVCAPVVTLFSVTDG